MAPNNKVVVATAIGDEADVPIAANNEVISPSTHKMNEDVMSGDEENQSQGDSVSQGPIGGSTDANLMPFIGDPQTLRYAQVQGLAKLSQVLNDPKREIEENIRKTTEFDSRLGSNKRCKNVRRFLTGKTKINGETVPYVLATWCMLGGKIPKGWRRREDGVKGGFKGEYIPWGQRMVYELGLIGYGVKFDICKDFDNGSSSVRNAFVWTQWEDTLDNPDDGTSETKKKSTLNAKSTSLGKHEPSSHRQSCVAKRQKTSANDITQHSGGCYADDDETEDQGSRGGVSKEVIDSGKRGARTFKTSPTMINLNREGFLPSRMNKNGHRDRENAPQPPQQIWATRRSRGTQEMEADLRGDGKGREVAPSNGKTREKELKEMNRSANDLKDVRRQLRQDKKGFQQESNDLNQLLKQKDDLVAQATAGEASDGVSTHRSNVALKVENDRLKMDNDELRKEAEVYRRVIFIYSNDLQVYRTAFEKSGPDPALKRNLQVAREQHDAAERVERQKIEGEVEIRRLSTELAFCRRLLEQSEDKNRAPQMQAQIQNASGDSKGHLERMTKDLEQARQKILDQKR